MLTWNLDWILSSLDNTHHSFVPSARRKQQEAERSAPVAPPPGQYNVQLDPLSVMAKKKNRQLRVGDSRVIILHSFLSGEKKQMRMF